MQPKLWSYLAGIARNHDFLVLANGGMGDHVHLLISQSKNLALSNLLKEVKGDSSLWIKSKGREFRYFHWQDGYGAFSFGKSDLPALQKYVATQKDHHKKQTFKEELIFMLEENGIEYDERYLWN